jgi:hypothetical protein
MRVWDQVRMERKEKAGNPRGLPAWSYGDNDRASGQVKQCERKGLLELWTQNYFLRPRALLSLRF